ncbi:hypothetical protein FACS1894211_08870 [Clostridia bacterium]|nr:hypothetical protein FACS1894211_08870 [Clostridia bacterium]
MDPDFSVFSFQFSVDAREVVVKYHGDLAAAVKPLNARVEILNARYAILILPPEQVGALASLPEIEYVETSKRITPALSENLSAACVTAAQSPVPNGYGLSGAGVAVGIIDSGVDFRHPDFRNGDGTTRILSFWDQDAQEGTPPAGFYEGAEYGAAAIDGVLAAEESGGAAAGAPEGDPLGHGTAVAGIAAGNGRASGGAERGVAPEAALIVVKLRRRRGETFSRTTDLARGLKYVTDVAEKHNLPLAVNISYGANEGPHDGTSLIAGFVDDTAERGKTSICVATGNEGASGHHFSAKVNAGGSADASFSVGTELPSLYLSIWKSFADVFTIELTAPDGSTSGIVRETSPVTAMRAGNADIRIYYGSPVPYNASQEILIDIDGGTGAIPLGVWRLTIRAERVADGALDAWLPTVGEAGDTAFSYPDPMGTYTIPSTAEKAVSVGAYDSRTNTAAAFSGRGQAARALFVKPDLAAPGVDILCPKSGGGYGTVTGTSMATPFATGAAALLMEWGIVKGNDPFLYGQRLKAFLQRAAKREAGIEYPAPIRGWGTLCVKVAIDAANNIR